MGLAEMLSVEVDCPSANEFVARARGALSTERARALNAHVDECAECRILLAEAAAGDVDSAVVLSSCDARPRGPAATFAEGEFLASRYVVVRWLAAGGMGEVYEVHDTWVDERIALKTIVASIADDPEGLARLKAEVRIARQVTHEHVCRVYDLGFHQRGAEYIAFLTMELLPGVTLRRQLARSGPFSVREALPLIRQMAEALRNAHESGIVHRDFKTDNVMLVGGPEGEKKRIVVMDFGLARQPSMSSMRSLTPHSRSVFGTLDYMSPEQVMGGAATPVSDVYSLGIVIYEMLAGRLPFEGESPLARAMLRVTKRAPPLSRSLPGIEGNLDALVARCLRRRPEERFASIDEVLRCLDGAPVPSRRRRRRARSAALAFALTALTGANLAVVLSKWSAPSAATPAGVSAADLHAAEAAEAAEAAPEAREPSAAPNQVPSPLHASRPRRSGPEPVRFLAAPSPSSAMAADVPAPGPVPTVVKDTAGEASGLVRTVPVSRGTPRVVSGDALLIPFGQSARQESLGIRLAR